MTGPAPLDWSLRHIADLVGGRVVGDPETRIGAVTTDSREDVSGTLFVALRGDRFDGHDFAAAALEGGAEAVLVDEGFGGDAEPRVVVDETMRALLALAVARRGELDIPVIALTGSSGKTSTKDLVAGGIAGSWASPRSFNNEIGVPLTVLGTPPGATALVLEVGSRGPGHIASLAAAVRPDVSIVTNLGVAHLEMFGSTEVLADSKYELIGMLDPTGTAVIPVDEPRLRRGTPARVITFGGPGADVAVSNLELDDAGYPTFDLIVDGVDRRVSLSVAGSHQALNAAAAVAAAVAIGHPVATFIAGMETARGSAWRMDVHRGRYTVVNDAYNANPASMRAAIDSVAAMPATRRIAVFGPMRELGAISQEAHRDIGAHAVAAGFDRVIVVGPDPGYGSGAGDRVTNAVDLREATDTLRAVVEPGDVVLVKASRAAGLERLALQLAEDATA